MINRKARQAHFTKYKKKTFIVSMMAQSEEKKIDSLTNTKMLCGEHTVFGFPFPQIAVNYKYFAILFHYFSIILHTGCFMFHYFINAVDMGKLWFMCEELSTQWKTFNFQPIFVFLV